MIELKILTNLRITASLIPKVCICKVEHYNATISCFLLRKNRNSQYIKYYQELIMNL